MKKHFLHSLYILLLVITIAVGAFFIYTSDYYHTDDVAVSVMADMESSKITAEDNRITLRPSQDTDTGIIFYPGAKVEYTAYLPLMQKLQQKGFLCVLVKMPFNLAFFNKNAADTVISEHPEITHWYLSGHSLGGAMASDYLSDHPLKADGLILLGAYVYGNVPAEKTLILYGSEDKILDRSKLSGKDNEYIIQGGNHAQFGNYNVQKGDGIATISAQEQQEITVEKITAFICAKQRG